jgi:hypothetical protein
LLNSGDKGFAAVQVIAEHIEARAGGRAQHDIPRASPLRRRLNRLFEGRTINQLDTSLCECGTQTVRILTNQQDRASMSSDWLRKRLEGLPLAIATRNQPKL